MKKPESLRNTNIIAVYSKDDAWELINEIFPVGFEQNEPSSKATGAPVYLSKKRSEHSTIVDNGDSLCIHFEDTGHYQTYLRINIVKSIFTHGEHLVRENKKLKAEVENLKARIAELEAEAEHAEAWNIAQRMTITSHNHRGW